MLSEGGNIFVPPESETNGCSSMSSSGMSAPSTGVCGTPNLAQVTAKIDSLKKWTVSTYKTTKQSICENLGKVDRTVDKELEDQIESLKDIHRRYNQVLAMSKLVSSYFSLMHETQKNFAESLYQLSLKEGALRNECNCNSESLRAMAHNGEQLERTLSFLLSSLTTLCDKTIEDTLATVHAYDQARLEYDVHRNELAYVQKQPGVSPDAIAVAEQKCSGHRERYERLREDVKVKLTLLEENRTKVMRKQLLLLHNALSAYFSGNAKVLQSTAEQFGLEKFDSTGCAAPSFLEQ